MKRALLAFVYFLTMPTAPLWSQPLEEGHVSADAGETVPAAELSEFPAGPEAVVDGAPIETLGGASFADDESGEASSDSDRVEEDLAKSEPAQPPPSAETSSDRLKDAARDCAKISGGQSGSLEGSRQRADFADGQAPSLEGWEKVIPAGRRFASIERFPEVYRDFVQEINRIYASPTYASNRERFLKDVAQNRFQAKVSGLGQLETKYISGQVCLRFVPENAESSPLVMLWVNVPLDVNAGIPPIVLHSGQSPPSSAPAADPSVSDRHLDTYRSRLLIDRKIDFSRLRKDGSWGAPHRAFLIVDQSGGEIAGSVFSPALRGVNKRWFKHWAKGTLEKSRYGDVFRGALSASIQFGLGYGMALLAQKLHPTPHPYVFGPAFASFLFSIVCAIFTDSYIALVQRGDNRTWESTKRLLVGAFFLGYPIAMMQAGGDFSTVLTLKTTALVWLVGFGDRYLSTVMNVVPKIHQKYFMKPWWFPVRMKTPFGDALARLTGDERYAATVKGVTWTREALAIPRFAIKFLGLFLDPILMHWTHGVPVATLMLWGSGIPFEIYNYYAVKKLAQDNPAVQEDMSHLEAHYRKILPAFLFKKLFPDSNKKSK